MCTCSRITRENDDKGLYLTQVLSALCMYITVTLIIIIGRLTWALTYILIAVGTFDKKKKSHWHGKEKKERYNRL